MRIKFVNEFTIMILLFRKPIHPIASSSRLW